MHLELTSLLQIKILTKQVLEQRVALLGRRQPRAQRKGKGKALSHCSDGSLSNESVQFFNDLQLRKTEEI
jgi:hypothetical protein